MTKLEFLIKRSAGYAMPKKAKAMPHGPKDIPKGENNERYPGELHRAAQNVQDPGA